ncbi:MAG TPA: hypothetical protein VFV31_00980 [Chitinophagaceae bacterium]|nr:hypothetical protein [Chitinophagaceae bacterium]
MKRKKIIRYALLSLLVIAAAAAIYIYKEFNRKHKDTAKIKADYSLTAAGLLAEFAANEKQAGEKYMDKVLSVEGAIKEILKDEKGFYTVSLGDTASLSSVRCSIDSTHTGEVTHLQKGTNISVKGICTGYNADELLGSDVVLIRSVVDNKK